MIAALRNFSKEDLMKAAIEREIEQICSENKIKMTLNETASLANSVYNSDLLNDLNKIILFKITTEKKFANDFMKAIESLTLIEQMIAIYNLPQNKRGLLVNAIGWLNLVQNSKARNLIFDLGAFYQYKTVEEFETKCKEILGGNENE